VARVDHIRAEFLLHIPGPLAFNTPPLGCLAVSSLDEIVVSIHWYSSGGDP